MTSLNFFSSNKYSLWRIIPILLPTKQLAIPISLIKNLEKLRYNFLKDILDRKISDVSSYYLSKDLENFSEVFSYYNKYK